MAEQAESIDNPLHEAAKRGRSDFPFSFLIEDMIYENAQAF